MKQCIVLLLLTISFIGTNQQSVSAKHRKVVACYVSSWATHRIGDGKYELSNLRPELCTHLIYSFAGLNNITWTITSLDPQLDIVFDNYNKLTNVCRMFNLKCSLAIGGWNEGSENYSNLALSPERRKTFIKSVLDYLEKFKFDGFDLDWEFPTQRGGAPADKENFVTLIKELKEAFNKRYLLTAAISANYKIIDEGYDIPEIAKYVDYIHVMTYDYHGLWDRKVLPNAPLRSSDGASVVDSIKYLLKKGAPTNKLVVGLPMYGRAYILVDNLNPNESPINKPTTNESFEGPYTKENGFMGYNEVCQELVDNSRSWRKGWDNESSTAYAVREKQVIVYDDVRSVRDKVNYVIEMDLAGVMTWSIDTDDFRGRCVALNEVITTMASTNYPLMRSIKRTFGKLVKSSAGKPFYTYSFILIPFVVFYF